MQPACTCTDTLSANNQDPAVDLILEGDEVGERRRRRPEPRPGGGGQATEAGAEAGPRAEVFFFQILVAERPSRIGLGIGVLVVFLLLHAATEVGGRGIRGGGLLVGGAVAERRRGGRRRRRGGRRWRRRRWVRRRRRRLARRRARRRRRRGQPQAHQRHRGIRVVHRKPCNSVIHSSPFQLNWQEHLRVVSGEHSGTKQPCAAVK